MSRLMYIETNGYDMIVLEHNGQLASLTAWEMRYDDDFTAVTLAKSNGITDEAEAIALDYLKNSFCEGFGTLADDIWNAMLGFNDDVYPAEDLTEWLSNGCCIIAEMEVS